MDQIFIHNLHVQGIIGISDPERAKPQEILINITLFADTTPGGHTDRIEDCINYRTIAKKVLAYTEKIGRYTVEALAADIAALCLEDLKVLKVKVRVEKPGAVRYADSVGVEIERSQPG